MGSKRSVPKEAKHHAKRKPEQGSEGLCSHQRGSSTDLNHPCQRHAHVRNRGTRQDFASDFQGWW